MQPNEFDAMMKTQGNAQEPTQSVAATTPVDKANATCAPEVAAQDGPIHPAVDSVQHSSPVHAEVGRPVRWVQPNLLDAPPPRPGYVDRWVWVGFDTEAQSNISTRQREGWSPRDPNTVPQGFTSLAGKDGRSGTITVQGMCLMEMPEEVNAQRTAFYEQKQGEIETAVQAELDGTQAEGGLAIQRMSKTSVVTGGGRKPTVLPDRG